MKKLVFISLVVSSFVFAKSGATIYKQCASCHGKHGEKRAIGRSAIIAKQKPSLTIKQLRAYKKGSLDLHGMGAVMKKNVANLTDKDIKAVANYIAHL
jgi:cytochrome c553